MAPAADVKYFLICQNMCCSHKTEPILAHTQDQTGKTEDLPTSSEDKLTTLYFNVCCNVCCNVFSKC